MLFMDSTKTFFMNPPKTLLMDLSKAVAVWWMLHNEVQYFLYDHIYFYEHVFSRDVYEITQLQLHEISSKCRCRKIRLLRFLPRKPCLLWVRVKLEEKYIFKCRLLQAVLKFVLVPKLFLQVVHNYKGYLGDQDKPICTTVIRAIQQTFSI